MTFTFTDPRGYQDLDVVNVLINDFLDARNACYVTYSRSYNMLYLLDDAGTALLPGVTLSSSGGTLFALGNRQCTVIASGPPVSSGNTLALTLSLTFSPAFSGSKLIWLAARDIAGNTSGWQPLGTWTVPGAAASALAAAGVTPAAGAGSHPSFTFTFTDTNGVSDIGVVDILINDSLDARAACYLAYSCPLNLLYIVNDAGTEVLPPIVPGQGVAVEASVSNSQCYVPSTLNMVSLNGNVLSLTLSPIFSTSFTGNRVIYMAARDVSGAQSTGWQAMGTWTVQ